MGALCVLAVTQQRFHHGTIWIGICGGGDQSNCTCNCGFSNAQVGTKRVLIWRIMTPPVVPLERGYYNDSAEQ